MGGAQSLLQTLWPLKDTKKEERPIHKYILPTDSADKTTTCHQFQLVDTAKNSNNLVIIDNAITEQINPVGTASTNMDRKVRIPYSINIDCFLTVCMSCNM